MIEVVLSVHASGKLHLTIGLDLLLSMSAAVLRVCYYVDMQQRRGADACRGQMAHAIRAILCIRKINAFG